MRTLTVVHQSTHRWFNGMGATPSPVLAESPHLTTHISWWSIHRVILLSLPIYFDSAKYKNVDFGPRLGIHEGILNTRNITIRTNGWIVKLQPRVLKLEGFAIFTHFPWSPIDWALVGVLAVSLSTRIIVYPPTSQMLKYQVNWITCYRIVSNVIILRAVLILMIEIATWSWNVVDSIASEAAN